MAERRSDERYELPVDRLGDSNGATRRRGSALVRVKEASDSDPPRPVRNRERKKKKKKKKERKKPPERKNKQVGRSIIDSLAVGATPSKNA